MNLLSQATCLEGSRQRPAVNPALPYVSRTGQCESGRRFPHCTAKTVTWTDDRLDTLLVVRCHTNSGSAARAKDPEAETLCASTAAVHGVHHTRPSPLSFLPIHTSTVQPVSERGAVDVWIKAANSMGRKRKTSRESWKLKCDPPGHPSGSHYYLSEWQSRNRGWNCWTLAVGAKNWIQKVVSLNSIGYHIPQVWLCRFELELQIAPTSSATENNLGSFYQRGTNP